MLILIIFIALRDKSALKIYNPELNENKIKKLDNNLRKLRKMTRKKNDKQYNMLFNYLHQACFLQVRASS
jgi:uncharacterized membrane protein